MKVQLILTDIEFMSYNLLEAGIRKLDVPIEELNVFESKIGPIYMQENQLLTLLNYLSSFQKEIPSIPVYDYWFIIRKHYVGCHLNSILAKYYSLLEK